MQVNKTLELLAVIRKEGRFYIALYPEFEVVSQGKSYEKALENLKEALALYLEDEDVEKPSEVEVPIVTIVNVDVSESALNLRKKSD
jgi:predicted RNase H-like HicB family nuclease